VKISSYGCLPSASPLPTPPSITKPGTIAELVSFIIKPVQEGADDNERFKYPYVACEIICCEVSNILEVLAPPSDHSHLRLLFSILEAPAPLDVRAAGYLEKVVTVLLKHKCPAIIECINEGGLDWFRLFIRHMSNFSVMKILRRLLLPRDVALNGGEQHLLVCSQLLLTSHPLSLLVYSFAKCDQTLTGAYGGQIPNWTTVRMPVEMGMCIIGAAGRATLKL
jgi:hypothetical protein